MDLEALHRSVEDVVDALWATDPREHLIVRDGWPAASCENVSAAIAVVLEERGLGRWTYVQASRPGETGSHAWLELRDARGMALYSIDRTLEQFPEWRGPFLGKGPSPASKEFTVVRWQGSVSQIDWMNQEYGLRLIEAVREQLSRERPRS